ncbi:MAG: TatD family hydrolase [Candidatus Eremiobacteraeota bacterium]|nr:TatD family hydrolase [Candidatus Eremiobacteraeota bacterium]
MIDTHCHIHDRKFDDDRDRVAVRAAEADVTAMLTVGEDVDDSHMAAAVAERYEIFAAVGIHPHEAKNAPADIAAALGPLLKMPRVVAIGETGLDYYYEHSPRQRQAEVVRDQVRLARETAFPVVFHQRDAFDDFVAILREEWSRDMRGVVHCFTGNAREARALVDEFGLFLGIGGVLTFPNASDLRDAVRTVGANNLVLETDAPYLAPVPMRGKRNEPAFIAHTAARLSEVLGISLAQLVETTDANAVRLLRI